MRQFVPFEADAASDRLGWVGLEAARYRAAAASELSPPNITHHTLVLFVRPPQELANVMAPRRPTRRRDGRLPRTKLRAVVEYIEEHLDASPTLEQMAAVARLSVYHFARQFKQATGTPPHQYVIARRVERAKELLQTDGARSLAEVAVCAGFSDQSVFGRHFKRVVGVTPGQFRRSARIA
jgi:AraC-like DNA-binding protein